MKYIVAVLIAGVVYLAVARQAPVAPAVTKPSADGSDFLKRPLDRTREVLQQARTRADDPALK